MIGIMRRGSQAKTPDGRTWEMLANFAGGKQSPGIMGVSTHYIRSPQFLRGDGGIKAVAWMDSELYSSSKKIVAHDQKVATEKDVATMDELRQFLVR